MKKLLVLAVTTGLLAGCESGVDVAKAEMIDSCVSSGGGRLTEGECACVADASFDSLDSEELAFINELYKMEKGTPDSEAMEAMGMDRSEFRRLSQSFRSKTMSAGMGAMRQCIGK